MGKPELGTKRVCPSCGTKYYDLNRNPIACPSCGTVFVVAAPPRRAVVERKPEHAPKPAPAVVAEVERDVDTVSLEEVEEEPEADVGPDVDVEDDEAAVVPDDVEIEVKDDPAVPDPFLEEEEGADVAGLLDVDAEPEEER